MQSTLTVRECRADELDAFVDNYHRMWSAIGGVAFEPDWRVRTYAFVHEARERRAFRAFVAEAGGRLVGSAGGQLHDHSITPNVRKPWDKRIGYVWGVYVDPGYRGHGLARMLMEALLAYFRELDCTHVRLHASALGRPVYERLGFTPTNEMQLTLR